MCSRDASAFPLHDCVRLHEKTGLNRCRVEERSPLRGSLGQTWQSLRQDMRTHLQEVSPGRRFGALIRRLIKYATAAVLAKLWVREHLPERLVGALGRGGIPRQGLEGRAPSAGSGGAAP